VQLLVIANLIKLKNVPVIIKAIAKLGKQLELKLTVVGDGPEKKALESLSRELAVADRVVFKGLLEPNRISECLEQADCLVLTSLSEGKPNVVLEAFAAGRPVVASNIDGVREMIGENENGLLFEARDEQMLAAKLLELFNNRVLYKKFSENGRKYILNNKLSWAKTGKCYADIYRELVETA
jgi:glycosyltransferase involved in cell wall biosynthesis